MIERLLLLLVRTLRAWRYYRGCPGYTWRLSWIKATSVYPGLARGDEHADIRYCGLIVPPTDTH